MRSREKEHSAYIVVKAPGTCLNNNISLLIARASLCMLEDRIPEAAIFNFFS